MKILGTIKMDLKSKIRDIPDFPKKGILFKDITTLLQDKDAFVKAIQIFYDRYKNENVDVVVGIESRGFIFASVLAYLLNASFVPVRKEGKLPHKTIKQSYSLEYGNAVVEIHKDAIKKGEKVVLIDDLIATGGTALAAAKLIEMLGGKLIECSFLIELKDLKGIEKLKDYKVFSIIKY